MNYLHKLLTVILLMLISSISFADTDVLSQGRASVSYTDIDGFAYTIPVKDRAGFFENPERIDKTVTSILTMKIVNKYAEENEFLDMKKINALVDKTMDKQVSFDANQNNYMELEKQYELVKHYFTIKAKYNYFLDYFNKQTKSEDLTDLAEEYYILNKEAFTQSEMRDIEFLSKEYNAVNKEEIKDTVVALLDKINKTNFFDVAASYKDEGSTIKYSSVKNYISNTKQQEFSSIVFKRQSVGLINDVIDLDSKFIIMYISKIEPEKKNEFAKVKDKIIHKIKDEKNAREFNNLLLKLTKDKVNLNKENFISLRTRYVHK